MIFFFFLKIQFHVAETRRTGSRNLRHLAYLDLHEAQIGWAESCFNGCLLWRKIGLFHVNWINLLFSVVSICRAGHNLNIMYIFLMGIHFCSLTSYCTRKWVTEKRPCLPCRKNIWKSKRLDFRMGSGQLWGKFSYSFFFFYIIKNTWKSIYKF